jgi:DUF971 family protein
VADAPGKSQLPLFGRDPNAPRDLRLVGRYALGVDWQDTHGSIYPFEQLRLSCPCPACAEPRGAAAAPPRGSAATWPTELKREGSGLGIRWQDGHETRLAWRALRQLCRCAQCTGGH